MKTNKSKQYTNELTLDILTEIAQCAFTPEQRAEMTNEARALIEEREVFSRQHPVTAIYRLAVAGCETRRGGVAVEFNPTPDEGHKICLENGQRASVLTVGCIVTYPDGSSARIINGAGNQHTSEGKEIALVGSRLDNGDEIISTPQSASMLLHRDGISLPDDFLTERG